MNLTSDNLTSIIIALITAVSAISVSRLSKRPDEDKKKPADEGDVVRLQIKLAECEEQRDRERAAFFRAIGEALEVDRDK